VCLSVCANLRRGYIDNVAGYGLFSTVQIESGSVILCETITNSFYEIISETELFLRYGEFGYYCVTQSKIPSNNNADDDQLSIISPYVFKIIVRDDRCLYLDQTTKRGVSSLLNCVNDVDSSNCIVDFEVCDNQIVLRVTTSKPVLMDEELKYAMRNSQFPARD
jgi:hypothetical protein